MRCQSSDNSDNEWRVLGGNVRSKQRGSIPVRLLCLSAPMLVFTLLWIRSLFSATQRTTESSKFVESLCVCDGFQRGSFVSIKDLMCWSQLSVCAALPVSHAELLHNGFLPSWHTETLTQTCWQDSRHPHIKGGTCGKHTLRDSKSHSSHKLTTHLSIHSCKPLIIWQCRWQWCTVRFINQLLWLINKVGCCVIIEAMLPVDLPKTAFGLVWFLSSFSFFHTALRGAVGVWSTVCSGNRKCNCCSCH